MSNEVELSTPRRVSKKPLGRGLGSLLGEVSVTSTDLDDKVPPKAATPNLSEPPARALNTNSTTLQKPAHTQNQSPVTAAQSVASTVVAKTQSANVGQAVQKTEPSIAVKSEILKPVTAPALANQTVGIGPQASQSTGAVHQTVPVAAAQTITAPAIIDDRERIWKIAIEKLRPNKEQPRKVFDAVSLQELVTSIKEKGVMLPIVARKVTENQFEIIAGERRWRAAQQAGLKEVPVLVRAAENRDALELALIENIQRKDLLPIEEAEAYGVLSTRYGLTQQEIAQRVGKDRSTVANLMRLMGLVPEAKQLMKQGELQLGQAKVLLSLDNPVKQAQAAKKVVSQQLSVRATERLVEKLKSTMDEELDEALQVEEIHKRDIVPLINELQKILGTKVDIDVNGSRSKVSAYFYSVEELNQFMDKIRRLQK